MANEEHPRDELAEERTERQKSERLRQCFSAIEMALATTD